MRTLDAGQMTIEQLQALLDPVYALAGHNHSGVYASASHSHAISDVTGLQTALDSKAASSHTHSIANVTGLQTALDAKAADSDVLKLTGSQIATGEKTFRVAVDDALTVSLVNGSGTTDYGFYNNNNGIVQFGYLLDLTTCIEFYAAAGNLATLKGYWVASVFHVSSPALASNGAAGGDVRLLVTKTGNGASQHVFMQTQRYAESGDPPTVSLMGKEVYLGAYSDGGPSHDFSDFNHGVEHRVQKNRPLRRYASGASNPTASDILAGYSVEWLNTTSGELRTWTNVGGTMYKSAAFTT